MIDRVCSDRRGTIELSLERESIHSRAVLGWSWGSLAQFPPLVPETVLAPTELAYWQGLEFPRRNLGYFLGRDAGKSAVGQLAGIADLRTFEIRAGVFQQPVVRGAGANPIGVSIAHCDTVACAVAFADEHPMGIDVEQVDAQRAAIMERELLPGEIRQLEATGIGATVARGVGWTAKEALSKVLRCGMTCPFSLLGVARVVPIGNHIGGEFENFGQYRFESWMRNDLTLTVVLPKRTRLSF